MASIDRLHDGTIESHLRSMEYETYFGEMDITEEQKQRRIEMAEKFEEKLLFILSLIAVYGSVDDVDWSDMQLRVESVYIGLVGANKADEHIRRYAKEMSNNIVSATRENIDNEYYTSYDRARFISENETNTIVNHLEDGEAIEEGMTKKTWHTMNDRKVRHTHREVEGKTIPIDEPFEVGGYFMDYPMDDSYGADPKEIVGCRCSVKYS